MNYWNDLESGPSPPKKLYAVIENTRGSNNYYQYDVINGVFKLERVLYSHILFDEGLIPRTIGELEHPLKTLVFVKEETFPGCVVSVRPIGLIKYRKQNKSYIQIMSVSLNDPLYESIHTTSDLFDSVKSEISYQIEYIDTLPEESSKIEDLGEVDNAMESVVVSIANYRERIFPV